METVILPDALAKKLQGFLEKTGENKTPFLVKAIETYIDDYLEDIGIVEEMMERVENGKEKLYSFDEVRQSLELDN